MHTRKKKLGEILVSEGIIRDEDFDAALLMQKESRKKLGRILVEMGYLSEEQLTESLARQLQMQVINLAAHSPAHEVLALIPNLVAQKKKVFPVELKEKHLVVAMADPLDWQTIDELSFRTGAHINVVLASESDILDAIEKQYPATDQLTELLSGIEEGEDIEFVEGRSGEGHEALTAESIAQMSDSAPIVKLVSTIFLEALRSRASDIHIEPGLRYVRVRFRVDGDLRNVLKYPKRIQEAVTSRIKIISQLDISNRRIPQDGRSTIRLEGGKDIDLRVSTLPTPYGEKVVVRILDRSTGLIALSKLGLPDYILKSFITNITRPDGLLLVTGPTGSGKTTTLYAVLNQLQSEADNIVTIEDPIEYRMSAITQTQISEAAGLTFAGILRSVFRQDPDIILVGEIRDLETADITVRAALTGHFVFSTLHTTDTVSTVTRLIDIGVPKYLLSATLSGIMSQRLVKRICPHCKSETTPPASMPSPKMPPVSRCFIGAGCSKCNYTGYLGRVGVYEFMDVNTPVRDLISGFTGEAALWAHVRGMGMKSLMDNALQKIEDGTTTIEEVASKIPMARD